MSRVQGSSEMFWKLAAIIVWAGATGSVLLTLRQSRLQASNEFAEARLRERQFNEQVSTVRSELAKQITPPKIEAMADELGVRTQSWVEPFIEPIEEQVEKPTLAGAEDTPWPEDLR